MARLTWQNVAAPDFSGISNHYRNMSDMLSRAAQSGQNALGIFQNAQQGAADAAIMERLALADPNQWDPASILGSDASRASTAILEGVANRPEWNARLAATRGQESRAQQNQEFTNWGNTRTQQAATRTDAANPIGALIEQAAGRRDWSTVDQLMQSPEMQALTPAERASFAGYGDSNAAREATRFNTDRARNQTLFDDTWIQDQALLQANGFGIDPGMNEQIIYDTARENGWSQQQLQRALSGGSQVAAPQSGTKGASANTPAGFVPSAAGTAGTQNGSIFDVVLGYGRYGNTDRPLTQMTMGEVQDFGKNVLIPATRNRSELGLAGTGKGSSAQGAFQITQQTLEEYAPRVIGSNWRNEPFSPENQERIAKAIFEDRKHGNLKDTWQGLRDTRPGAYANRSWEDVRNEIISVESRTNQAPQLLAQYAAREGRTDNPLLNPIPQVPVPQGVPGRGVLTNEAYAQAVAQQDPAYAQAVQERDIAEAIRLGAAYAANPTQGERDVQETRERNAQRSIASLTEYYEEQLKETPGVLADAATALAKKRNANPGTVNTRLEEITAKFIEQKGYSPSPAVAAALLDASLIGGSKGADLWGVATTLAGNSIGSTDDRWGEADWKMDESIADRYIEEYTSGRAAAGVLENANDRRYQERRTQLSDQIKEIDTRMQSAMQTARTRGIDPTRILQQLEQQKQALQAELGAMILDRRAVTAREVSPDAAQQLAKERVASRLSPEQKELRRRADMQARL